VLNADGASLPAVAWPIWWLGAGLMGAAGSAQLRRLRR
jgi:hypothetical protein